MSCFAQNETGYTICAAKFLIGHFYTLKKIVSRIYVASYSVAGPHMKMCRSRMCRTPDCVAAYSLSTHSAFCCARAATYKGHGRMYKTCTFSMSLVLEYFSSPRRSRIRREIEIGLPRSGSIEIKSTRGGGSPDVAFLCSANARKIWGYC